MLQKIDYCFRLKLKELYHLKWSTITNRENGNNWYLVWTVYLTRKQKLHHPKLERYRNVCGITSLQKLKSVLMTGFQEAECWPSLKQKAFFLIILIHTTLSVSEQQIQLCFFETSFLFFFSPLSITVPINLNRIFM